MSARRYLMALGTRGPSGRSQDDEAAIGLDENLEDAVEQLGQHVVERDGLAQVVGDLDHRPQLHLGIGDGLRADRRGEASSFDMMVELARVSSSSTSSAVARPRLDQRRLGRCSLGSCEKKVNDRSQILSRSPFCSSCRP